MLSSSIQLNLCVSSFSFPLPFLSLSFSDKVFLSISVCKFSMCLYPDQSRNIDSNASISLNRVFNIDFRSKITMQRNEWLVKKFEYKKCWCEDAWLFMISVLFSWYFGCMWDIGWCFFYFDICIINWPRNITQSPW